MQLHWFTEIKKNTDKQNVKKRDGDIEKKAFDVWILVTTTVLNIKLGEVEN